MNTTQQQERKDWRDEAVKLAAQRYGKPFRCGPDGIPREIIVKGVPVVKEK